MHSCAPLASEQTKPQIMIIMIMNIYEAHKSTKVLLALYM